MSCAGLNIAHVFAMIGPDFGITRYIKLSRACLGGRFGRYELYMGRRRCSEWQFPNHYVYAHHDPHLWY